MAVDPFARPDLVGRIFKQLDEVDEDSDRLVLARKLRNLIIGNKQRKIRLGSDSENVLYLGSLLENEDVLLELRQECAAILGITAFPDSNVLGVILSLNIPVTLASFLESRNALLLPVLVALRNISISIASFIGPPGRSLHVLGQAVNVLSPGVVSPGASSTAEYLNATELSTTNECASLLEPIFNSDIIPDLMALLHCCIQFPDSVPRPWELISMICEILGGLVQTRDHQRIVLEAYQAECASTSGAVTEYILIEQLVGVLQMPRVSGPEHVLSAISALVRANTRLASRTQMITTSDGKPAVQLLGEFLQCHNQSVRIAAAQCITNLHKAVDSEHEAHFPPALRFLPSEIIRSTIVTLLRLISRPDADATSAAFALAYLVSDDPRLQPMARDLGAFTRLENILSMSVKDRPPYPTADQEQAQARLREGILLAVASLSLTNEKNRKSLIDAGLLDYVISMLSDPSDAVRTAACQCARALSRSVGVLRTHLIEAGSAEKLFALLEGDNNDVVVVTACATLANLLIEFSPMKEILLRNNYLPLLIQPIKSSNPVKRLHGLLAIKNLAFWAESSLKETLMEQLTWDFLALLCNDPDQDIQAQSLGILRNVACNKVEDVDTPLDKLGSESFLAMIEDKLESPSDQILVVALNILQNLVQSPRGKQLVLKRLSLLVKLMTYINHTSAAVCVPAIWTTMSLARRDPGYPRQSNENAIFLRSLGFEERLREVRENEPSMEIRERVTECLEHFDAATFRLT